MEQIWKQLQSPEWWFTAVFVGLVVGVAGPYANSGMRWLAGRLSTNLAARLRIRYEAKLRRIQCLVANPHLLTIEFMRGFALLALAFLGFFFSMVVRAWKVFVTHFPDADPISDALSFHPPAFMDALLPYLFLVGSLVAYWQGMAVLMESRIARRRVVTAVGSDVPHL